MSDIEFTELVAKSFSRTEVGKKLGLARPINEAVDKRIRKMGLNTSHFVEGRKDQKTIQANSLGPTV